MAVFARAGFNVECVQDLPEYGMSWFHIKRRGDSIYACVCYLPHVHSSYLRLEDGHLSAEAHYVALSLSISKFRALGEVIIMGDMNARTARVDDRCDESTLHEWHGLEAANISIPRDIIHSFTRLRLINARNSYDTVSNRNGGLLIDMCRNQGMLILNGRLPGDSDGDFTYFQHGDADGHASLRPTVQVHTLAKPWTQMGPTWPQGISHQLAANALQPISQLRKEVLIGIHGRANEVL